MCVYLRITLKKMELYVLDRLTNFIVQSSKRAHTIARLKFNHAAEFITRRSAEISCADEQHE